MDGSIVYQFVKPGNELEDFVDSFWMLHNTAGTEKDIIVLPDGRVDLSFQVSSGSYSVTLLGLETHPQQTSITEGMLIFAVSFKLLAAEYILQTRIGHLLNGAQEMPSGFWDMEAGDLLDLNSFIRSVSKKILQLFPIEIDERKRLLFKFIYTSQGEISVKELSERSFWSARQINRYFNQQFGISLKAYCNILRFRASFQHIKEGKLFPEQKFTDQSHFIREIKKLAGTLPKELHKNENGRFIQFTTLHRK